MNRRVLNITVIVAWVLAVAALSSILLTGSFDRTVFYQGVVVLAAVGLVVQQVVNMRARAMRLQQARAGAVKPTVGKRKHKKK